MGEGIGLVAGRDPDRGTEPLEATGQVGRRPVRDRRRHAGVARTRGAARRRRTQLAQQAQRQRPRVHVRFEPRSRAGRAATVAAAAGDQRCRAGQQLVVPLPEPRRQPDPAGHGLVQVDGRFLGVGRAHLGDQAEIARIHHQQDRGDGLDRPPRPEEGHVQLVTTPVIARPLSGQPVSRRLELKLRQVDRPPADVLVGQELELLEQGHEARDHHLAVDPPAARGWAPRQRPRAA